MHRPGGAPSRRRSPTSRPDVSRSWCWRGRAASAPRRRSIPCASPRGCDAPIRAARSSPSGAAPPRSSARRRSAWSGSGGGVSTPPPSRGRRHAARAPARIGRSRGRWSPAPRSVASTPSSSTTSCIASRRCATRSSPEPCRGCSPRRRCSISGHRSARGCARARAPRRGGRPPPDRIDLRRSARGRACGARGARADRPRLVRRRCRLARCDRRRGGGGDSQRAAARYDALLHAGAGIVAGSGWDAELEETRLKMRPLLAALLEM